jgi:hypothetical protein
MKKIHTQFAKDNADEFEPFKAKRIEAGKTYNHESAFTSMLINTNENTLLQTIYKTLGKPKNISFEFDGLLVEKDDECINSKVLVDCMIAMTKATGIEMKLKVKPMDEGYKIPKSKLPVIVNESTVSATSEDEEIIEEPKPKPKKSVKLAKPVKPAKDIHAIVLDLIDKGHVAMADYIKDNSNSMFVCSIAKTYELYFFNGTKWVLDAGNTIFFAFVSNTIYKLLRGLMSTLYENGGKKDIDMAEDLHKVIKKMGSNTYLKDVHQCFCRSVYDKDFLGKLDSNIDLIGFDDGTYDLVKKI